MEIAAREYEQLAKDPEVAGAIDKFNATAKPKAKLGPPQHLPERLLSIRGAQALPVPQVARRAQLEPRARRLALVVVPGVLELLVRVGVIVLGTVVVEALIRRHGT